MIKQRTIKNSVEIEGTGLQTGQKVRLRLKSAPANSGINFIRIDLANKPLLNIRSFNLGESELMERRMALGTGPLQVQTIEHLLAALAGFGIDNLVVEVDNIELPGLDGSARDFVEAIKKAKIAEQDSPKDILKINSPVWCGDGDALLIALPDDDFRVTYTMSYENLGLGTQYFSITLNESNFESEIAPARTFCSEEEALELLKRGLGKGANYDNTLVIGKAGPIENKLRFQNEPVRHKVLDLIGDLYLLGMPIKGRIVAVKSGHRLNLELVKRLKNLHGG